MAQTLTTTELAALRNGLVSPMQAWQAAHGPEVYRYALAWQQTGERDFLGKAVGGLRTFVSNYQKDWFDGMELVAFGDGTTKTFQLKPVAHGNYGGGVHGKVSPRQAKVVVKSPGDTDAIDYYADFVRVWDDVRDYANGVDWVHSGDDGNNVLRWLAGGNRPASGSSFNVEITSRIGGTLWRLTPTDSKVTFAAPPAAGDAVYAIYCYSIPGGLPYQETVGGLGGFNLVYVDQSFAVKFLDDVVKALAIVGDHPEFLVDLRAKYDNLLPRWLDYVKTNGYMRGSLQSNYGVGGESFRAHGAFYLKDRNHPRGQELVDEMVAFWRANKSQIIGPEPSNKGGWWSEGWNYGALSTMKLADIALLFESHGENISDVRPWFSEVAAHLVHASPKAGTIYDGGDWFQYPVGYPNNVVAYLASLGIPLPDKNTLPLDHRCEGTGLFVSRDSWADDHMMVTLQSGKLLTCDHQQYTPGQFQVWVGGEPVIQNGPVRLDNQSGAPKSRHGNVPIISCPDRAIQNYEEGMGYWYGEHQFVTEYKPGLTTTVRTNNGPAWSHNSAPGAGGPCEFATRDLFFLKGKRAVVLHDKVGIRGDWPYSIQFCCMAEPVENGWWKASSNGRDVFIKCFVDGVAIIGTTTDHLHKGNTVRFLRFALSGRKAQAVTVIAADSIPNDPLSLVTLDTAWPPSLVAPPPPTPNPNPTMIWTPPPGVTGYAIANGPSTPGFVVPSGATHHTWASGSQDPRSLDGLASAWYSATSFSLAITLPGPAKLSVYVLDWDRKARSQTIEYLVGGVAVWSQEVSDFGDGKWITFDAQSSGDLQLTNHTAGQNAVVSGVFADPVEVTPPPPPVPATWVEEYRFVSVEVNGRRKVEVFEKLV